MPNFPTYRGELPACLNPLNPRHYFLLAYWVFFRPTALKCYLYQADPELYKWGKGKEALFGTRHILAYRNLYLMAPIIALFFGFLVAVPFPLMEHFIFGIPVDIFAWLFKVIIGVADGLIFGMAVGMAVGVTIGVASGVAISMVACVTFGVGGGLANDVAFWVAHGLAFSVTFSMAIGVAAGITLSVVAGVAASVIFCIVESVLIGIVFIVGKFLGSSRAIFYPVQWVLSLFSLSNKVKHPLFWDELVTLPLSDVRQILNQTLQQNEQKGLCQLAEIMSNPFQ
ncbi:MAG: hypothetical protein VSS75_035145, partial [Candidatus Parabeggiatoa sp.]|nr:hypothetical protein [Candidatus Parabeggiatoa sp.]